MAQQGGGDDKNSNSILWGIFLVFAVGSIAWWNFSEDITEGFLFVRYWQLKLINQVTQFIPYFGISKIYSQALGFAENVPPSAISINDAKQLSVLTGRPLGLVYFGVLFYLFRKIKKATITAKYKKKYDMLSLREQERSVWPQVNVVNKINLLDMDLDEGPWAMAETPMHFAKRHDLLKVVVVPPSAAKLSAGATFNAQLNKQKATQIFTAQLGRIWKGHKYLPNYKKALLAAFFARGCRDTASAMSIIRHYNASLASSDEVDFTGVDELLEKHIGNRDVQELIALHAYESTIFIAAYLFAREDGVFPTSDFLWVKPMDRRFWYTLNNVGRQTPSVEAGGIYAHFLAEKSLNRPMTVPMVNESVKSLEYALNELIYQPSREEKDELFKDQGYSGI